MKLSILEQVPCFEGHTSEETLSDLQVLAQGVEAAGYRRIWLAEHHNSLSMLSSAPDILAGYLLANTDQIRVGTGGVMAMHYGSLQMAERFNTLASLYPGRVDMGLGRAPGGDITSAYALNQGRVIDPEAINDLIEETLQLMRSDLPQGHPYGQVKVTPKAATPPEYWLLGSSGQSAAWAGHHQMNYAYAQFFTGHQDPEILNHYRANYQGSKDQAQTLSALCVVAGESEAEAQELALTSLSFRYSLMTGRPLAFQSPDAFSDDYKELLRAHGQRDRNAIIGSYDQVAERIKELQAHYQADEIMLVTYMEAVEDKLKMYQALADRLI